MKYVFRGRVKFYHRSYLGSSLMVSTTLTWLSTLNDVSYDIRNRSGFEAFRIDANDSDISFGDFVTRSIIHHFEIVSNRLLAFELGGQPHPNRVAVGDWFGELSEDLDTRHPYVVCLEQFLSALSSRPKQLFFGLFEESKKVREKHDAGVIGIRPIRLKPLLKHESGF